MSCSTSGAMISSAAMATDDPPPYFFPRKTGSRVVPEICFPTCQFLYLPVVDWHCFRRCREVIPKIFHKLQFLRGAQIENVHRRVPFGSKTIFPEFGFM